MSYIYALQGSNSGYPLEQIKEPEPEVICELCGEPCEDFILEPITSTLSIIVGSCCYNQDQIEYQSIIEYVKTKKS